MRFKLVWLPCQPCGMGCSSRGHTQPLLHVEAVTLRDGCVHSSQMYPCVRYVHEFTAGSCGVRPCACCRLFGFVCQGEAAQRRLCGLRCSSTGPPSDWLEGHATSRKLHAGRKREPKPCAAGEPAQGQAQGVVPLGYSGESRRSVVACGRGGRAERAGTVVDLAWLCSSSISPPQQHPNTTTSRSPWQRTPEVGIQNDQQGA